MPEDPQIYHGTQSDIKKLDVSIPHVLRQRIKALAVVVYVFNPSTQKAGADGSL